jgi:hypothetical protein
MFNKAYFDTEGPLGLPMKDKQAKFLEQILKAVPPEDRVLRRAFTAKAQPEIIDGERADISWITTECPDLDGEIVIAKGMNDTTFAMNPIVTFQHDYCSTPVGTSLWRKKAKTPDAVGIRAKTHYPTQPAIWGEGPWPADTAFSLIQSQLLNGKSIGFIRLKWHQPSSHEIAAKPEFVNVTRIIDEWLLIEYACTFLPTNPEALVQQFSKANVKIPYDWERTLNIPPRPSGEWPGIERPDTKRSPSGHESEPITFTPMVQYEEAVKAALSKFDTAGIAKELTDRAIQRAKGAV